MAKKKVPLKWNDQIIGWATPGEFDFEEQSQLLLDVEFLPEEELPEGVRTLVRLTKETMLRGLSIED